MELVQVRREVPRDLRRSETARLFAEATTAVGERRSEVLNEIIVLNTQLAYAIARRFRQRGVALEDLEQVACVALVRATHRFDPEVSEDFLTYAVPTISGEVKRYFRDHGWTVRPTRRLQELDGRIRALRGDGTQGSPAELAEALGVPVHEIAEAMQLGGCFTPSTLDAVVGGGSSGLTLGEMLTAPDRGHEVAEARVMVAGALTCLTDRERRIVQMRFVEDLTQQQIGDRLGITQMQVSRLLRRLLDKLREHLQHGADTGDSSPAA